MRTRIAAAVLAALTLTGCGGSDGPDDFDAYKACENFVSDRLRAPATAEFSGVARSEVTAAGPDYVVSGYLDAENGFGGQVRSDFTCTMELTADTWRLVDLSGL